MSEEKKATIKAVKTVAQEFGEHLQNRHWDEAFEAGGRLNTLLKNEEVKNLTDAEKEKEGFHVIQDNLRKYFFWSGELRKAEGALVAKGKNILGAL